MDPTVLIPLVRWFLNSKKRGDAEEIAAAELELQNWLTAYDLSRLDAHEDVRNLTHEDRPVQWLEDDRRFKELTMITCVFVLAATVLASLWREWHRDDPFPARSEVTTYAK